MKRFVICVLFVGCGGDGSGTIELDNLGLELAVTSCSKQFECCTDAEIMEQFDGITYDGQPIATEQQCVDFANAFFTSFAVGQYKQSLAKGRIEYDGAAAADCVAALERLTCAELSTGSLATVTVSCRPFIIPKVADGGACAQSYECISDNCEGASNPLGEPSTDGACKPMPTAGQACDESCADGLYCGFDLSANMDVCLSLKADGAECRFDHECASDNCDDATDVCASAPLTCDGR